MSVCRWRKRAASGDDRDRSHWVYHQLRLRQALKPSTEPGSLQDMSALDEQGGAVSNTHHMCNKQDLDNETEL